MKKLLILRTYLNGTKELVLTFSANGMNIKKCFVDTSYTTHTVIKINTESAMKMVKGNTI